MSARREGAWIAGLAAIAVVVWALVPTYPNYDAYYSLVWGREILHGVTPSFEAYAAPTQHPAYVALGVALAALFGDQADRVLVLVAALSLVALVWAVLRAGRAVFGRWPGIVAALLTGSSFALLLYAARAYVDMPFLALVLWAAALEAERPRRATAPRVLLAIAGLLRPEAWILAGAYWLWCVWPSRGRPPRLGLLALAIGAPLIWALTDAAVTGDPLHSLHATSTLADALGRERGLSHVPTSLVSFLSDVLRPPVFLAGLGGAGLVAARWRQRPAAIHVPIALVAGGVLTFVATGIAGLAILPRYLTVPAVGLTLFAGYALAGWTTLPGTASARRAWSRGVVVLALLGAVFVVTRVHVVSRLATEVRFIRATHDDLAATLRDPRVQAARRCGPVTLPNYRLVPDTRWILNARRGQVGARSATRHEHGVALFFTTRKSLRRFGFADGASASTNAPDPGYARLARHGMIVAYVSCPGAFRRGWTAYAPG